MELNQLDKSDYYYYYKCLQCICSHKFTFILFFKCRTIINFYSWVLLLCRKRRWTRRTDQEVTAYCKSRRRLSVHRGGCFCFVFLSLSIKRKHYNLFYCQNCTVADRWFVNSGAQYLFQPTYLQHLVPWWHTQLSTTMVIKPTKSRCCIHKKPSCQLSR